MDTLALADDPGIIYKKRCSCKLAILIDDRPGIRGVEIEPERSRLDRGVE
jgi:hypothetical protein